MGWDDRVEVTKEMIKSGRLQKAWQAGRVEKCCAGSGWEKNLRSYVVYGRSGGTKEAVIRINAPFISKQKKGCCMIVFRWPVSLPDCLPDCL